MMRGGVVLFPHLTFKNWVVEIKHNMHHVFILGCRKNRQRTYDEEERIIITQNLGEHLRWAR